MILSVRTRAFAIATCYMSLTAPAFAFEFSTHAAMTREALRNAQISRNGSAVLDRLGLTDRASDLGTYYIDIGPSDYARSSNPPEPIDFGKTKIRLANINDPLGERPALPTFVGWAMLGAIREDDVSFDDDASENTPQDDPSGAQSNRVLNHFYDPVRESGAPTGSPAVDWALGVGGGSNNHFSVLSAREAMWRALTLTRLPTPTSIAALSPPIGFPLPAFVAGENPENEALRYAYWATVFRSLGDVVHLLQDMGQPQHTRLDAHGGRYCIGSVCVIGHPSYYEGYIEAKVTGASSFHLREQPMFGHVVVDDTENIAPAVPGFSGYTAPALSDYKSYFTTAASLQSAAGKGLSNYSNQGFLTATTNIGSGAPYSSPPQTATAYQKVRIPANAVINAAGDLVNQGAIDLLQWPVKDNNSGQSTVVNMTSYGAFDQFVNPLGSAQYSLNHYNYDDHASLLLPRAVAYSAGLIDYFFRGAIDISLPGEGVYGIVDHTTEQFADNFGFRRLKVTATNRSPLGEDFAGGRFVLVAKYHRDKKYVFDLSANPGGAAFPGLSARSISEDIVVSNPVALQGTLPVGSKISLTFDFQFPVPINATDLFLQVVYRGKLGTEDDAVVVGTKDISEPTFVGFANITDYVWDSTGQRFMPLPYGGYMTPSDVSLKLRFDSPTGTPIATIPKLSAKQHAQIAVLTDVGSGTIYYNYQPAGILQPYPTVPVPFPATQFYSPVNSNVYDANVKVALKRGVYRQTYASITYPYEDIAACLPGYELCTQSTLPALSPADRVPWTIRF